MSVSVSVSVSVSMSYEKIMGGKSLQRRNTETTPPHNLTWPRRIQGACLSVSVSVSVSVLVSVSVSYEKIRGGESLQRRNKEATPPHNLE